MFFLMLHNDDSYLPGELVHFFLHGDSLDDIVEFHLASLLRDDRRCAGPLNRVSPFYLALVGSRDDGSDHDVMVIQLTSVICRTEIEPFLLRTMLLPVTKRIS